MLASLLVADNFPSTWPKIFHFETSRGSKYISDVGDAPFVAPNCQSILRKSRSNKFLKVDEINTKEFLDALKQKMFGRSMDNGRQDPQLVGDFTDTQTSEKIRLAVASNYIVTVSRLHDENALRSAETGFSMVASEYLLGINHYPPTISLLLAIQPKLWAREILSVLTTDLFSYFDNLTTIIRSLDTYPSSRFKLGQLLATFQKGQLLNYLLYEVCEISGISLSMSLARSLVGCQKFVARAGLKYLSATNLKLQLDIWDTDDMVLNASPVHRMVAYNQIVQEFKSRCRTFVKETSNKTERHILAIGNNKQ